jgi:hypothetical protein
MNMFAVEALCRTFHLWRLLAALREVGPRGKKRPDLNTAGFLKRKPLNWAKPIIRLQKAANLRQGMCALSSKLPPTKQLASQPCHKRLSRQIPLKEIEPRSNSNLQGIKSLPGMKSLSA